ncbi:CBO0543 family protein [Tumebacillus avium]|uniref:CBO0543 family protein n=1 Tax=Tumebacillus avium TaxID=1903704 RepID=UPI001E5FD1A8|nr:CBO0543 family protein [Tumebacillus avium]
MEKWILYGSEIGTILALLLFVPKRRLREAIVLFMFPQLITWATGLFVVELRLIEYPYRSLPNVTRSSLDFEFFVYPALIVLFNLYYPERGAKEKRFWLYAGVAGAITFYEVLLEKYTDLIAYHGWAWYWSFVTVWVTLYISRRYFVWFRKSLAGG